MISEHLGYIFTNVTEQVLEEFLDHVTRGKWPAQLCDAISMRYTLLAHAHTLGEKNGSSGSSSKL